MWLTPDAASIAANVICRRLDGGSLKVYSGAIPPSPSKSKPRDCLFSLPLSETAFQTAEKGVAVANPIGAEPAERNGVPTWFAATAKNGDVIFWGTVGRTRLSDLVLDKVDFKTGDILRLSEFVYEQKSA